MIQIQNLIFDMIKVIYVLNGVYRVLESHSSNIKRGQYSKLDDPEQE